MRAHVGDQLRVHGHRTGEPDRFAAVLEVRGPDGVPPFVVRWDDAEHDVLYFPGADAVVEPLAPERAASSSRRSKQAP